MSQDPYPSSRPDPDEGRPYSDDPYAPVDRPQSVYGGPPSTPPPGQPPAPGELPPGAPLPPPYPYPPPTPPNTSAIVLTVLAGVATMTGYCCYIGIPGLIFGILGIAQQSSDPEGAARMTRIGWIVCGVLTLLTFLAIAAIIVIAVLTEA